MERIQEKREGMGDYVRLPARADGSPAGWSMERKYYKDPTIFELERERFFNSSWVFAGHTSQIPESGDWFLFKLLDEGAIIVRQKDGSVRAFHNVCRHRGSVICKEASGNTKRFMCPYHAWTYGLDGALVGARSMPDDIDLADIRLHDCPTQIIDGLIFICFGDEPPSLAGAKRDLAGPLAMYDFANTKVAKHERYEIEANWKVTLENYQECYHCAPSHPEYSLSHTLKVTEDRFDALQQPMMDRMEACGVRHYEVDRQFNAAAPGEEQYAYSRYALFEKYKTGSKDGEPVAPLLGNLTGYDHGASDISIGPFTYMLAYNDHVVVYVFTPTGHETSACDIYWLVRGDAEKGQDYDLPRLTWLWDVTTKADKRIIVDTQMGINSSKYSPGPLARMEYLIDRYITWYLEKLLG